ncbi:MAG: hypothetical protein EOM01_07395 [Spirochaetia bacterium]|nr:hypothetical protein [Spirochaetia bacterium]
MYFSLKVCNNRLVCGVAKCKAYPVANQVLFYTQSFGHKQNPDWERAMRNRDVRSITLCGCALLCMLSVLCVSCRASYESLYGSVAIDCAAVRTIQPSDEDIAITHLKILCSQSGAGNASLPPQVRQMGSPIVIDGLLPGTWEITVCGLGSDDGEAVVTREASQSILISSGQTSRAIFSLSYLTEGFGTCAVSLSWSAAAPSISTLSCSLTQEGQTRYTVTDATPFSFSDGVYTGRCASDGVVEVGTYDLDILLTNRSGARIQFPNLESIRIFSQRHSEGTLPLSFPSATISHMVQSASFASDTPVQISICAFPLEVPIYYTTDGTDPTTSSNLYTAPLILNRTTTVKAVAALDGYADSAISTGVYTASNFAITTPPRIGEMDIITSDYQTYAVVILEETGLEENHYSWYVNGILQEGEHDYHITLAGLAPGTRFRIMAKVQKGDQSLNTFTHTENFTIPVEG